MAWDKQAHLWDHRTLTDEAKMKPAPLILNRSTELKYIVGDTLLGCQVARGQFGDIYMHLGVVSENGFHDAMR